MPSKISLKSAQNNHANQLKLLILKGLHNIDTRYHFAILKGSKGFGYCVKKSKNGFVIKELWNGTGNYKVYWEVKTVRMGYENYRVKTPINASSRINRRKL
ncbi:MAG: hypothetical protein IPK91_13225 [Saprospiraceae bacterium]|nr:hypothetical protein [Saprospiraceae bacterium]MBK8298207.1 hypothetical protein [Saprospiraceae bacterium]